MEKNLAGSNSLNVASDDFFIADANSLCDNAKGLVIDDMATCMIAASIINGKEQNVQFRKEESRPNWPKGCYKTTFGVYFNKHSVGNPSTLAQSICLTRIGIL